MEEKTEDSLLTIEGHNEEFTNETLGLVKNRNENAYKRKNYNVDTLRTKEEEVEEKKEDSSLMIEYWRIHERDGRSSKEPEKRMTKIAQILTSIL